MTKENLKNIILWPTIPFALGIALLYFNQTVLQAAGKGIPYITLDTIGLLVIGLMAYKLQAKGIKQIFANISFLIFSVIKVSYVYLNLLRLEQLRLAHLSSMDWPLELNLLLIELLCFHIFYFIFKKTKSLQESDKKAFTRSIIVFFILLFGLTLASYQLTLNSNLAFVLSISNIAGFLVLGSFVNTFQTTFLYYLIVLGIIFTSKKVSTLIIVVLSTISLSFLFSIFGAAALG